MVTALSSWAPDSACANKHSRDQVAYGHAALGMIVTMILQLAGWGVCVAQEPEGGRPEARSEAGNDLERAQELYKLGCEARGPRPAYRHCHSRHDLLGRLADLGPVAREAIGPLIQWIGEHELDYDTATALGRIGGQGIELLVERLKNGDALVRRHAAEGLDNADADAAWALPALEGASLDPVADVADKARRAIAGINARIRWERENGKPQPRLRSEHPLEDARTIVRLLVTSADEEASRYFRAAAEIGLPDAQYALAEMYLKGRGVEEDAATAARLLREAAVKGHAGSCELLGALYRAGRGVPRIDEEAEEWYRQAGVGPIDPRLRRPPSDATDSILALTTFEGSVRCSREYRLREDGTVTGWIDHGVGRFISLLGEVKYIRGSRKGGSPYPFKVPQAMVRQCRALLSGLPESVNVVPIPRMAILGCWSGDDWAVRIYDRAALPRQVHELNDILDVFPVDAPAEPNETMRLPGHTGRECGVAFDAEGRLLSWGGEPIVRTWDPTTGRLLDEFVTEGTWRPHPWAVCAEARRVLTVDLKRALRLVDMASGETVRDLGLRKQSRGGHGGRAVAASFSHDGRVLAISHSGTLGTHLFDGVTGEDRGTVYVVEGIGRRVAVSPSGGLLAANESDGAVKVWDTAATARRHRITGYLRDGKTSVAHLTFSPDGSVLAITSWGHIVLWDIAAQRSRVSLRVGDWYGVTAFSPDGKLIAGMKAQWDIRVWRTDTGERLGVLKGHRGGVVGLAFSPDGSMLASCARDGTIRLWDMKPFASKAR